MIYQADNAQLVLTRIDHLSQTFASDKEMLEFDKLARTTQVFDVKLSGRVYKLFLQPWTIASLQAGEGGFIVAGLVEKRDFRYDTFSVSSNVLALICFVLLLLVSSYPYLKILLLSPRQPLRLLDALLLLFWSVVGLALLTLSLIDVVAYRAFWTQSHRQLEGFAGQLAENFEREVRCAYAQVAEVEGKTLEALEALEALRALRAGHDWECKGDSDLGQNCPIETGICTDLLNDSTVVINSFSPYPYLHDLALIDTGGQQMIKWSVSSTGTPPVSVAERIYFRNLLTGNGLTKPHFRSHGVGDGKSEDGVGNEDSCSPVDAGPFYLESIFSMTDGWARAVLAKRHTASVGTENGAGDVGDSDGPAIVAMLLPMLSVIDPVIPEGFGFAVVDETGEVLFHSDKHLNLGQNLVTETDDDGDLRAALFARREQSLDLVYGGRDQQAYIRPLESFPWSIVTFYDQAVLRSLNVDMLIVSSEILLLLYGLLALIGLGALILRPTCRAAWIWPLRNKGRERAYALLSFLFGGLALIEVLAFFRLDAKGFVFVAALVSVLAVLAAWLLPRCRNRYFLKIGRWLHRQGLGSTYVWAGFFLGVVLVVMPVVAVFRIAHATQVESLVKYHQLRLARDIQERRSRLASEYSDANGQGLATLLPKRASMEKPYDVVTGFLYDLKLESREASGTTDEKAAGSCDAPRPGKVHGLMSWLVETTLPHFETRSTERRGLLVDSLNDQTGRWRWHRDGQKLRFEHCDSDDVIVATVPELFDGNTWDDYILYLCLVLSLILLVSLYSAVRFAARRVLLVDLEPPEWIDGQVMRRSSPPYRFLVVGDYSLRQSKTKQLRTIDATKLRKENWRADHKDIVESSDSVLIRKFDEALATDAPQALELADELGRSSGRTVVLESQSPKARLLAWAEADSNAKPGSECLRDFVMIQVPWLRAKKRSLPPDTVSPLWNENKGRDLLEYECHDPTLYGLRADMEPVLFGRRGIIPTREQILEEVGERAESYYENLWESCTEDEKLVLFQAAREGLVNAKNRRVLRRLLGCRILRLCPTPTLMNESFRRFVLRPEHREAIKLRIGDSTWDRLRGPLLMVILVSLIFVATTQQDIVDTTVALLTGLAAGVPVVLRLLGSMSPSSAAIGTGSLQEEEP